MKKMKIANGLLFAFLGLAITLTACKKEGCTDPLATNYNSKANHDDGTCNYDGVTPGTVVEVTENVDVPTTWSASTIKVCGDIEINAALTINPGVTVIMCASSSIEVHESGSIKAIGNVGAPIVFKGEVATKGYWSGIHIRSNNPNNQFDYVTVSDAGSYWFWEFSNVSLAPAAQLGIKNSTINGSQGDGLFVKDGAFFSSFSGNTFSNNALAGLNITVKNVPSLDASSNYNLTNGENFIRVRGNAITSNATWIATTTPLLIEDLVYVSAGLTLSPGMIILMEAKAGFQIEPTGYFTAIGNAVNPIRIQGRFESAGYWDGFDIRSNNPNNKMEYVVLKDGGSYWANEHATIDLQQRLEMNNCTINNSNSWAIFVRGSGQLICSGTMQTEPSGVTAVNNLTGNGLGPDADCVGGGCTVIFD